MTSIHNILHKYWGYETFRPLQEDIIQNVLKNNDTLALLPTGGGKSICYQVPTLTRDGLCIVISPLLSLIKDQVEGLKTKGIVAVAIHSGMHKREIDIALDYCVFGKPKFLFVSPERLDSELFKVRVQKMKVNLIAVDEAHCISQWGYDFRPSYLTIANLRELLPNVPVLALTATATPNVVDDIKTKLAFKRSQTFFQTFARDNLIYVARKTDNKIEELKNICKKLKGSGIVYARNRRRTVELAHELNKADISAGFYHAGIPVEDREKAQLQWKQNSFRIMLATNAFGMGIDKPDVRFVIHYDVPDSPEAYYQEAGRAGRDQKMAYAIVLYNLNDFEEQNYFFEASFPDKETIRKIYVALGNFFKLAVGSGLSESFVFDLTKFCKVYPFKPIEVLNALKIIEIDGMLSLSDAVFAPSRLKFEVNNFELYNFQIKFPVYENFTKLLLRKYPGVFDEFVRIKEGEIASLFKLSINEVKQKLQELTRIGIIKYIEQTDLPFITYTKARILDRDFKISKQAYDIRKANALSRLSTVKAYIQLHDTCRNTYLLNYFGETVKQRCGKCDNCIALNKLEISNLEFEKLMTFVMERVNKNPITIQELNAEIQMADNDKLSKVIDWLLENEKIVLNGNLISRV